ncbi:serine hydrolase [Pandoraea horticolens]|uniref:Serine hydrolase n=1 Tax=Pandoraea horticolens TaxID=2508298 RepID=A0A5E4VP65_9BURK|nr:serine hydrolase domain-containing protein [Pandoraea horticolens]VVE14128.1 serine hydrolase [Pandoraea horticolens]
MGSTSVVELDELFQPFNRSDAPGLVVGVAKHGQTIYRKAFGLASLEHGVANTPATRMRIGSTSKHFTALLALLLAEENRMDLDAPIRRYLPELTGPGGDPTVRQLLQHRGGSRCFLDIGFLSHGMALPPLGEAQRVQVRQADRNFPPGTAMIYNNGGYHLVSIAIERAGGAPFERQLKDRLFDPVGMLDTASVPSDFEITPRIATLHLPTADGRWRRGMFPSEEVRGEGAIVSTIDDMLTWAAHLRDRHRFGSSRTWSELTALESYADGDVSAYALGLVTQTYRGVRVVHHPGGVIGGSSQMLTVPDHEIDIVIFSNGAPGCDPAKLALKALDALIDDKLGPNAPTASAEEFPGLLGDWWSPESGMVYSLVEENNALSLTLCGFPVGMPLRPERESTLVASSLGLSDITISGLDSASDDRILISFGGQSIAHRRVNTDSNGGESFASAVLGSYWSDDANCRALIEFEGPRLVLRCSDAYGQANSALTFIGDAVAIARQDLTMWSCALSFAANDEGEITGFQINSPRTRHLRFVRRTSN